MGYPSAICIAGSNTSRNDNVPNSASITMSPPGLPGVTAASGPSPDGYLSCRSSNNSRVAPVGATPHALIPTTFFVRGS